MKYNSNLEPAEMSYFRLNLLSFLRDAHPDKANDLSFIAGRGDMAAEAYSEAIKSGLDHIQAGEIANVVLFEDLHFSPYSTIIEVLRNEFSREIAEDTIHKIAENLLWKCKDIFEKYDLDDNFSETPKYSLLYSELTGKIQIIFENGIQ